MRKIEITEINIQSPDFKSGILNNQPKDRTILNWLIQWVEDGLNKDILHFGDLIPSKKELAKYLNVSTGTLQNAVKYAEDLGYFKSRQCIGTIIVDKNNPQNLTMTGKVTSKKDVAVFKIKKYIIEQKLKKGDILPAARVIANEIDTSQNTSRLALDVLVREGVLIQSVSTMNKSTKVLNCDYTDIQIKKNEDDTKNESKKEKDTLSKQLYTKIKQYISKNYKLNDKIMPNADFAKMFNVSVRTINDAMKRLNKEKIILSLRGRYGTRYINEPDKTKKMAGEKSKFMSNPKSGTSNIKISYSYDWQRVLDQIKKYMITHHEAGDKLPSMKNLSNTLNVSTNTIRRAVNEMVKQEILFCQRGKHGGIYIVEMPAKEDAFTWLALNPKFLVQ